MGRRPMKTEIGNMKGKREKKLKEEFLGGRKWRQERWREVGRGEEEHAEQNTPREGRENTY